VLISKEKDSIIKTVIKDTKLEKVDVSCMRYPYDEEREREESK